MNHGPIFIISNMKYQEIPQTGSRIPVPENFHDAVVLMQSDFYRATGRKMSLMKMWMKSLTEPGLKFSFWLRLSQVHWGGITLLNICGENLHSVMG